MISYASLERIEGEYAVLEVEKISFFESKVGDFSKKNNTIKYFVEEDTFIEVEKPDNNLYYFEDSLTTCTKECIKDDDNAPCNYKYDNNEIILNSEEEVSCNFYFKKTN